MARLRQAAADCRAWRGGRIACRARVRGDACAGWIYTHPAATWDVPPGLISAELDRSTGKLADPSTPPRTPLYGVFSSGHRTRCASRRRETAVRARTGSCSDPRSGGCSSRGFRNCRSAPVCRPLGLLALMGFVFIREHQPDDRRKATRRSSLTNVNISRLDAVVGPDGGCGERRPTAASSRPVTTCTSTR